MQHLPSWGSTSKPRWLQQKGDLDQVSSTYLCDSGRGVGYGDRFHRESQKWVHRELCSVRPCCSPQSGPWRPPHHHFQSPIWRFLGLIEGQDTPALSSQSRTLNTRWVNKTATIRDALTRWVVSSVCSLQRHKVTHIRSDSVFFI